MSYQKFEVITDDFMRNETRRFDSLDEAYIYWKRLPKYLQRKSHILLGHEVLL